MLRRTEDPDVQFQQAVRMSLRPLSRAQHAPGFQKVVDISVALAGEEGSIRNFVCFQGLSRRDKRLTSVLEQFDSSSLALELLAFATLDQSHTLHAGTTNL